jgi:hypothetical protein
VGQTPPPWPGGLGLGLSPNAVAQVGARVEEGAITPLANGEAIERAPGMITRRGVQSSYQSCDCSAEGGSLLSSAKWISVMGCSG